MYKVGIIGCGRIAGGFEGGLGRVFPSTHAGAYLNNPNTNVVSISDNDNQKLIKFAKHWEIDRFYQNYKEMLLKEKLDLISVCTHDNTHYEIIDDIINAGIKNIFCEKPLGKSSNEISKMISSCKKHNVNLIVNHSRRWNDRYIYLKHIIKQNKLGSIISITGRYTSGVRVVGSHMIDIMRFLVGEVIFIKGIKETYQSVEKLNYSENFDANDLSYSAIMKFKNGVIGFLDGSSNKDYLVFEIEMQFRNGKIILSNNGEKLEIWFNLNDKLRKLRNKKIIAKPMMENAVNHLVEIMTKRSLNNVCNGNDGFEVIKLIEKIEQN